MMTSVGCHHFHHLLPGKCAQPVVRSCQENSLTETSFNRTYSVTERGYDRSTTCTKCQAMLRQNPEVLRDPFCVVVVRLRPGVSGNDSVYISTRQTSIIHSATACLHVHLSRTEIRYATYGRFANPDNRGSASQFWHRSNFTGLK